MNQSMQPDFVAGEVVGGKYVIERVIGSGGVGIVVAARHSQLDETVAIKFLRKEVQSNQDIVRRFAREAKAAVQIKSEYAVRVFDVGEVAERGPYFVMEYLEGRDLGDVLAESGPMAPRRAVEYLMQTCEALAVAHSSGIVHRDIKPENLFLARRRDGSELIKVLDFGISKAVLTGSAFGVEDAAATQDLMGSPLYMSPEQIRATADVDHRTDIWSLGVVLYELLTGHAPFPGETLTKICAAVLEDDPLPLDAHLRDLPEGLQQVVSRCLQKDVTKRFQNVAELAIALLPFGPTMARIFAERTSSILRAAGQVVGVAVRFSSAAPPGSGPANVHIPQAPPIPLFSAAPGPNSTNPEALDALARESVKTRRIVVGVGLLAVALALVAVGVVVRGTHSASTLATAQTQPVLIESEPAGARVEWDGKLLGETPLTLRLPVGSQSLKLTKDGYSPETLGVNVTADGADKHSFITLKTREVPSASVAAVTKFTRAPAATPAPQQAKALPTAPRTAAPKIQPAPVVASAPAAVTVAAASPMAPTSTPPKPSAAMTATAARVRVVDDTKRVRILDDDSAGKAPLVQ
jgi:serine/threonine protein kinase